MGHIEEQKPNLIKTYFRVIRYASKTKALFVLVVFLTLVSTGLVLVIPYIFKLIFDSVQKSITNPGHSVQLAYLGTLGLIYFVVSAAQSTNDAVDDYLIGKWWYITNRRILIDLFEHVSYLSLDFYEKNPSGKIRERIYDGSMSIVNIIETTFLNIFPQLLLIVAVIFILFRIQFYFGLIVIIGTPLFFSINWFFRKRFNRLQKRFRVLWEELSNYVNESISNIRTIKTFATEKFHLSRLNNTAIKATDVGIERSRSLETARIFRGIMINFTTFLILVLGAYWTSTGLITLGTFILVWQYQSRALDPITCLTRNIDDIQQLLISTALTFNYLDAKADIADPESPKILKIKTGTVSFKDVTFDYGSKNVLKNFNFQIPPGRTVAIVGKSGVGKTTVVKLLLRFYDPKSGSISIDRLNIKDVRQKDLRESIAVVMQDTALFNDTALANINYAKPKAKRGEIMEAAKAANADNFIQKLPKGYNTVIGERGIKLSGGEQQRINIARAVLKNAPILILDEATSSLDSESEVLIQDAIWKLVKGRTTIIIAHRLSTVMKSDLIVVMDKGKIPEIGTHNDLVAKKGIYAKLFEIQSGGYLK